MLDAAAAAAVAVAVVVRVDGVDVSVTGRRGHL